MPLWPIVHKATSVSSLILPLAESEQEEEPASSHHLSPGQQEKEKKTRKLLPLSHSPCPPGSLEKQPNGQGKPNGGELAPSPSSYQTEPQSISLLWWEVETTQIREVAFKKGYFVFPATTKGKDPNSSTSRKRLTVINATFSGGHSCLCLVATGACSSVLSLFEPKKENEEKEMKGMKIKKCQIYWNYDAANL